MVREDDRGDGQKRPLEPSGRDDKGGKSPRRGTVGTVLGWEKDARRLGERTAREQRLEDMKVVREKLGCLNDMSEIYSPPRVAEMARKLGMAQGFSLDLTCPTAGGYRWDFWRRDCRRRALELVRAMKPYMLMLSPECRIWSQLQNCCATTVETQERLARWRRKAEIHLKFCSMLCWEQMRNG